MFIRLINKGEQETIIHLMETSGLAYVTVSFNNTYNNIYIYNLCVKEEYRGSGIGTRVIKQIEEEYKLLVKKKFATLSVLKDKPNLVAWYKRLGYEVYSSSEKYLEMIKTI